MGYVISGFGLLTIIIGLNLKRFALPIITNFNPASVLMAGVVLVVAGVVFSLMKKTPTEEQAQKEVPIYAGDKIVGYRRK